MAGYVFCSRQGIIPSIQKGVPFWSFRIYLTKQSQMSWCKTMELIIREEKATDIRYVSELIKQSFKHKETAMLVSLLRKRKEFIRDLSLVAEINSIVAGFILLSPVKIRSENSLINTLWMEPVCVHPHFRKRGIGTTIIKRALVRGKMLGFESVFVTGSFDYYSRFGFKHAKCFGIDASLNVSLEAFLALELKENALWQRGKLIFPQEIFG